MITRRTHRAGRIVSILALSAVILGAVAAPVSAHADRGPRVNLFDPPATMAAGTPFYLSHGYCTDTRSEIKDVLNPRTRVDFTLDGRRLPSVPHLEFDPKGRIDGICIALKHERVYFWRGLPAGLHTITGCWYYLGELELCLEAEITFV